MDKKGLSAIITTVLLILLVLIMIFVIWLLIRNFTQSGGEQVPYSSQCLKIGVEPVKCIYANNCSFNLGTGGETAIVGVTVRRNSESGTLAGLAFLFENNASITRRLDILQSSSNSLPGEGEYALEGLSLNESFIPEKVNVAAIVGSKKQVCGFTSSPIACLKERGQTGRCADQNHDGNLSILDWGAFQNNFAFSNSTADINKDGIFDIGDFVAFCAVFNSRDVSGCT